jgi:pantoate--beta-alanine ligase
LEIARTVADLRKHIARWRKDDERVGLVPTMGALHQGHMALVLAARTECDRVVASIFVNPKQFAPTEDLGSYPRREAADLEMLRSGGVDLLFIPALDEMYPPDFATLVRVSGLTDGLCGAHRAGHFDGVTTVVTKLLIQALPDIAYFGEKDYQQLTVVRRMARDLDIPVLIAGVPTVREADGLALSSRNVYLSAEERRTAPNLARVLRSVAAALARDPRAVQREIARGSAALQQAGFAVEYLEIREAESLAVTTEVTASSRVFAAVRLGTTRLIDNMPIARD